MRTFSRSSIRVQPYFGYRNRDQLFISARALRSGKPSFSRGGRWQAMRTMLSQFASREVAGLDITLEVESPAGIKQRHSQKTDKEGFVHFEIALDGWPQPEHSSWEVVAIYWTNAQGVQCVEGHVLVPGRDTRLGVISDIDDTIIETGITGSFRAIIRNWRRVLSEMPDERLHVPGVDVFYNALGGGASLQAPAEIGDTVPAMTSRPFFYVSSSPWNLFSYLVSFQKSRNLPLGPVMLRDWGLDRKTFGSSSHGAHKKEAIDAILKTYPEMRFALIGDDTQGDLTAFGAVVSDYPGRIAAVFVRKAGEDMTHDEIVAQAMIESSGVPLWLGSDYSTGRKFLKATGLAVDGDAVQIVDTIDKARDEDGKTEP